MFTNTKSLSTDLSTSIPQGRSIFAIFVHYGPKEITDAAVASLRAGEVQPDHIIVIDHTEATVNVGYAGGLAEGLRQASALGAKATDICLLLNNDIEFKKDSLQHIVAWWDEQGGSRVLGGAAGGYVSLFSGRAHIASEIKKANPWILPYIHGSCLVGEYSLLSSGILPTSFFLYWEDIVTSMRVSRKAGQLAVIPELHSIHNDAPSSISFLKLYYMVRNGAYVLERYTPVCWRMYWYIVNTLRMAYHAVRNAKKHRIITRALYHARVKKLGKFDI